VNDTPSKLLPCITTDDLWNHMKKFQAIADANPSPADGHPSRNSGEPGYKASADYVAQVMKDAGYNVTIQQYTFTYYAYTGIPAFSQTSPTPQDFKGGSSNHVVVVDAHLDAIYGAGMLDNASGSATILDVAQQMKNVNPLNKLRFIWFGGEELGLLGSTAYINSLSSTDKSHIGYDLDADVMATPNYTIGVLDPAGPDLFTGTVSSTFPNRVYKASTVARDQAIAYFDSTGRNHELFSPVGDRRVQLQRSWDPRQRPADR
jgi:Zn-dependent M28 family amino/carboxypeptidase